MSDQQGYRGYVSSRPVRGVSQPQRLQNLVIRDYSRRKQLDFLLSSTEFAMPGCYMMLEDVINELDKLQGIILYSAFMLPQRKQSRLRIYDKVLTHGCVLHSALEEMVLKTESDIANFEDVIEVVNTLPNVPLNDAYQSFSLKMDDKDDFVKAILDAI